MLLDGFVAPNANGRSVASVVENRLIGIVGNCLVMPVARGFHLDPTYRQDADKPVNLLHLYAPNTPVPPMRISVPTRGVFAEAVMGSCNSCEERDDTRFWRWEESPCPDEPTPIEAVSTESRRAEPPDVRPTPFPSPIINLQNAPAAPDPTGLAAALQVLGNPNLFRDITGLTENQRNALAALQAAFGTAQFFGGQAANLALQQRMARDIDRTVQSIQRARQANLINDQQASTLTEGALRSMIGGGTQAPAQPMTTADVERLTNTAAANQAAVTVSRPGGENVSVNAQLATASLRQPFRQRCGFFAGNTVISEQDLRDAIVRSVNAERANWFDAAGNALAEGNNAQFGHLVRYWLARFSAILPSTLTAAQVRAIGGGINYGQLLNAGAADAVVAAEAARVRADLLADAPGVGTPANLNALVEQALISARQSAADRTAWSAVFVVGCIRRAAIGLALEAEIGGTHVGRDELLLGHEGHRVYVLEAFRRRFGPSRRNGTYHAFRPSERPVQVGDIVVLDRQAQNIDGVWDFDAIPALVGGRELHGDIVVEVAADNIVTIGGNVGEGVRRRRYPINADGRLVVAREQRFTQETPNGNLPAITVNADGRPASPAAGLHDLSTGRIFTLLSPVELCVVLPDQRMDGSVIV